MMAPRSCAPVSAGALAVRRVSSGVTAAYLVDVTLLPGHNPSNVDSAIGYRRGIGDEVVDGHRYAAITAHVRPDFATGVRVELVRLDFVRRVSGRGAALTINDPICRARTLRHSDDSASAGVRPYLPRSDFLMTVKWILAGVRPALAASTSEGNR
jgi:hypothetical protein